jgi:predicted ribosome quality control (RQC) complex YloA/Tae2 family protein
MRIEVFLFNSEKYIIMIGRNKKDNFEIIDNSVDTDIWFHIYEEPSCHVILKNTDKMREIPKQVMKRCAYLCKINSKSKILNSQIYLSNTYWALRGAVELLIIRFTLTRLFLFIKSVSFL